MPAEQRPIRDNILFIVGGVGYTILGALCCIFVTESNVSDLRDLSVIVDLSDAPRPCGFAVPSLAAMMTDLNFEGFPLVTGYRASDSEYVSTALRSICVEDTVEAAVARLWGEAASEVSLDLAFLRQLCGRAHVRELPWYDQTGDNLQDPASRIRRAYVRAQPAFQHYYLNRDTGNCNWKRDPFDEDADGLCAGGGSLVFAEIQTVHLEEAASDERVCGASLIADGTTTPITTHTQMVYRLLLLAVLAESDRRTNSGACFGNTMLDTVEDFCANAGDCSPLPSWVADTEDTGAKYPWEAWTVPVDKWASNEYRLVCASFMKTETGVMYPEETLRARYEYDELTNLADAASLRYSDASLAAKEHCMRTHEYSSRSGEFLFDLPDIDSPPAVHPVGFAGGAGGFFIDLFYNPWFADVRNRPYNVLKKSALRDAIAFEGFRFGISLFLRMPALYAAGFFTGRGVMLCVGSVVPAIRNLISGTPVDPVQKPRGWALTTLLAVVVSVLSAVFSRLVDPLAIPEASKTTCEEYGSTGRVFDSSQVDAIRDYIATILLLLVSLFAIVWELFLKRYDAPAQSRDDAEADQFREQRGMSGILLLLFVFGLLLEAIVCSQISIDSGFNLQENVLFEGTAGSNSVQTDMLALENDVYFFHAVAIAHAAVIGIFTTLFAVAGPVAEGRYLGLVLWLCAILASLAVGFARFAHTPTPSASANTGNRDFAVVVTAVLDVALAVYAVYVACTRYRTASAQEAQEGDAKQEAVKRSLEAPVGDSSLSTPETAQGLGFESLPLLALRPQR